MPMGETIPSPVMTGWCLIAWLTPGEAGSRFYRNSQHLR
jgi:hypothetical protein